MKNETKKKTKKWDTTTNKNDKKMSSEHTHTHTHTVSNNNNKRLHSKSLSTLKAHSVQTGRPIPNVLSLVFLKWNEGSKKIYI
mmetsp:Transcript_41553/g.66854  ORF Transcript_41553/g.66854 Transcript_41553/m.66854 type:complete len:83 (+) Transcript_41553:250-498(+)